MNSTGYVVRSNLNPKMIYCTDGDWHHEIHCGPLMWSAKVYKTARGARTVRSGAVLIQRIDAGVPVGDIF